MLVSGRMKRVDPYSTPARRRRIIADVAKSVLRQWYIKGCDNVYRFRKETSASIKMQCFFRAAMARYKLTCLQQRRRNLAATKIQTAYRRHRAIFLKIKLLKDQLLMRQKRLVRVIEHLWVIRKAKLFRAALVIARRLAQEKRRNKAARDIQRIFRGHYARQIVKYSRYHRRLMHFRRYFAVSVIQKNFRRWRCQLRYIRLRKWHRASHRITSLFIRHHFWKNRERKRHTGNLAAIQIQCWYRCMRAITLKKRLYLNKLMRIPRYEITRQPLEIQLELSPKALGVFASRPVSVFMHWCLQQCLLQYSVDTGYRAGSVVHQVIASVSRVEENQSHHGTISSLQKEVDIKVDAWDYSSGHLEPNHAENQNHFLPPMPEDWDIPLIATSSMSKTSAILHNSKEGAVGDEICCRKAFSCNSSSTTSPDNHALTMLDYLLQLNIRSLPVTTKRDDSSKPPVVYQTVYETIIRFVPTTWTVSASVQAFVSNEHIVPSHLNDTNNDDLDALFLEDAVFRFQNAMVYVPAKPLPAPIPTVIPTIVPAIVFHDSDSEDDNMDLKTQKEVTPVKELPTVIEEKNVTTIRIHLSTPSPPPAPIQPVILSPPKPPLINYGHMARRIQRKFMQRLRRRIAAVKVIQYMQRRYWRLEKWRNLVYEFWEQCFDASVIIQCAFRLYNAKKALKKLRFERDEWYFPFGHDFEHSTERENWRAFGMVLPDLALPVVNKSKEEHMSTLEEFCFPNHFLHLSPEFALFQEAAASKDILFPSMNGTSESSSMPNLNITHPPILQLVQKLAVPDMPPNCLFPQSWMDTFVFQDDICQEENVDNKKQDIIEDTSSQRRAVRFQETMNNDENKEINRDESLKTHSRSVLQDSSVYESMLITHFLSGPSPLVCYEQSENEAMIRPQMANKSSKGVVTSESSCKSEYSRHWKKQSVRIRRWQRACWGTPLMKNKSILSPSEAIKYPLDQEKTLPKDSNMDSMGLGEVIVKDNDDPSELELELDQWETELEDTNESDGIYNTVDESLFVFNGWLDGSVFDDQGRHFSLFPVTKGTENTVKTKSMAPLFPASFYYPVMALNEEDEIQKKKSSSISRPLTGKVRPDQRAFFQQQKNPHHNRTQMEDKWKRLRWMTSSSVQYSRRNIYKKNTSDDYLEEKEELNPEDIASKEHKRRLHAVQSLQAANLLTPVYTHLSQHGL